MRRMFILDPVCAQLLGHNLTSLVKFKGYFEQFGYFDEIVNVASRTLSEPIAAEYGVERGFGFYYHNRMKIADINGNPIVNTDSDSPDYEEQQAELATADFAQLFEQYGINSDDSIFFPSVDFYAAMGLFDQLRRMPASGAPRVYVRFIGVMEYASTLYFDPKRELLRNLRDCIDLGYPISVSAESAVYADHLSVSLAKPVACTPVPPFHDPLPMDDSDEFVVISPGSGRIDKGFNLLPDIIRGVRKRHSNHNIRFIIQNLSMWDLEHNMVTARQIYAAPGVDLLPSSIGFSEMTDVFQRSHLVLMPYCADIYALRSSAILTESVGYGRQILTSSGTGFETEVAYFNLGKVCQDVESYVSQIIRYCSMPRKELASIAIQAKHRYSNYCISQYKVWLQ